VNVEDVEGLLLETEVDSNSPASLAGSHGQIEGDHALERETREDGIAECAACAMDSDAGDEPHVELAGEMLGLRLEDLLDPDHVGVDLPQDLRNASEADPTVEAPAPVDVVRGHPNQVAGASAGGAVHGSRP
jgi:hypothetical protein